MTFRWISEAEKWSEGVYVSKKAGSSDLELEI